MKDIKEYLITTLQKTDLFEMAYERREFVKKVCEYFWEITTNALLIKYAKYSNKPELTQNIAHWLCELDSYVNDLNVDKIKCKKISAVREAFDKKDSSDEEHIRRGCFKKLKKENIKVEDIPSDLWNDLIRFINDDIVEIICDDSLWDTENALTERLGIN